MSNEFNILGWIFGISGLVFGGGLGYLIAKWKWQDYPIYKK